MSKLFENQTVLITGGSKGVGAAAALLFARAGANVVIAARASKPLEAMVQRIEAAGASALAIEADVADLKACRRMIDQTVERFGGLQVLVNNAGFNDRGAVELKSEDKLAQIVDVNLRAPIYLARLALPHLRRAGRGVIINVASLAGRVPLPDEATYSATKFGLRTFSFALAEELRGTGVHVSVVSPGPIDTGFIMENIDEVPDIVFSQPMSTAEQIAALIVRAAKAPLREQTCPRASGYLATLGYLVPRLQRAVRPLLERQGRKNKARFRR